MSERDFIDSLKMVEIENNEQLGSLLDSLKDIYSSEEIEQRLAALTFSIWSDYIKAYEYQLRVEDLQKEVDSLQAKLDKYIEIAGKLTMQVREQNSQLEEYKIDQHYKQREIDMLNKCLKDFGERQVNMMKLKYGNPIAYRHDAGIGQVLALHREGLTRREIAERLGVGETTVYRRFNELREAGLIKDVKGAY